ncbi:hypothetical protein LV84_03956 [Algoriphagus ratkowskyi]|uniref:Uncharacterized protein n=1 Tax=Algoriphagus ratkowskyi TaxID=57028 RepID=A0A2W7RIR8_9BACT|nr:hypothetical protein [Algoriphagus ratkowskyi]PZX50645.1 hypothetical protein LV84_03956 [Algoriphagus ratkowskyi]TXD80004.1 hypothetical protein ESW18_02435 [Algoriphagus ratkowskyi]
MKTKATLIIGAVVATVALYSCETKNYTEADRVQATKNLENYVDSVERAVKTVPVHNWSWIDERFDSLESRADKVYKDLDVEDDNLEMLEERYEVAIKNGKAEADNFERTAKMHMDNVDNWWGKTSTNMKDGTKVIAKDIETATKESMDWLDKNFDKLSDDTKRKYEKITVNLQRD